MKRFFNMIPGKEAACILLYGEIGDYDRVRAAASELYFFKMLMKVDTNIGFGEEFIALDWRADGAFKPSAEQVSHIDEGDGN